MTSKFNADSEPRFDIGYDHFGTNTILKIISTYIGKYRLNMFIFFYNSHFDTGVCAPRHTPQTRFIIARRAIIARLITQKLDITFFIPKLGKKWEIKG